MREIRTSGSEGGGTGINRFFLPLSGGGEVGEVFLRAGTEAHPTG